MSTTLTREQIITYPAGLGIEDGEIIATSADGNTRVRVERDPDLENWADYDERVNVYRAINGQMHCRGREADPEINEAASRLGDLGLLARWMVATGRAAYAVPYVTHGYAQSDWTEGVACLNPDPEVRPELWADVVRGVVQDWTNWAAGNTYGVVMEERVEVVGVRTNLATGKVEEYTETVWEDGEACWGVYPSDDAAETMAFLIEAAQSLSDAELYPVVK